MAVVKKAILKGERELLRNGTVFTIVFLEDDEDPVTVDSGLNTGAGVVLTGYTAVSADDVEATDTVNAAIAKLEARIADLETP